MRFLIFTLSLFYSLPFFSQTEKCSIVFDFGGVLSTQKPFGVDRTDGFMDIKLGYALFDQFIIGANYRPALNMNPTGPTEIYFREYGMFSQYYFFKKKNRLYFQADYGFEMGSLAIAKNKVNAGVGLAHFISENVSFNLFLNYNIHTHTFVNDNYSNQEFDVLFRNINGSQGFDMTFGLGFFLPKNSKPIFSKNKDPLWERYVKKGNKAIEAEGDIFIKEYGLRGIFHKSKFTTEYTRLRHRFLSFGALGDGGRRLFWIQYDIGLESFFPVSRRFYFTPLFAVGGSPYFDISYDGVFFGWNGQAQAAFRYFFNNTMLHLGLDFSISGLVNEGYGVNHSSHLFFTPSFFISEKLALSPTLYYALSDQGSGLHGFDEDGRFAAVYGWQLRFGMSYFY